VTTTPAAAATVRQRSMRSRENERQAAASSSIERGSRRWSKSPDSNSAPIAASVHVETLSS
jgi:hypothetical protein